MEMVGQADPGTTQGAECEGSRHAVCWWWSLEVLPTLVAATILAAGVTALSLAVFGVYRPEPAIFAGAVALVIVARWLRREAPATPRGRTLMPPLILVAFVLFGALLAVAPSEHLYVDRDPAVYNNTAAWISSSGGLRVDVAAVADLHEQLVLASPGNYREGDRLEFQFGHLTGGFLAVVLDVGGPRAMYRASAFVTCAALVAVYCVARRLLRRPLLALVAPAALGFSMPVVAVGRDTYSEPYAMLFLWTGVLVLLASFERASLSLARVGGVLLGAGTLVRFDGIIYLAVAVPALAVAASAHPHRDEGRKLATSALSWTVATASLGLLEMWVMSTGYVRAHSTQLAALAAAVGLSVLTTGVAVLISRLQPARQSWNLARPTFALLAPSVVLVAVAAMWWLRPLVQVVRAASGLYLVENLQRAEGLEPDGTRHYYEESVVRVTWYVGVLGFGLASVGTALSLRAIVLGRASIAQIFVTAIACISGVVYFWNPSINPDHVWAMRRFVPAVLPAICLMMAWTIAWIGSLGWGTNRRVSNFGSLAVSVALVSTAVITPLAATWPVRLQREQYGMHAVVAETCESIPPGSLVVVVGPEPVRRIMQTLRSWCGVDVAGLRSVDDMEVVDDLRRSLGTTWQHLVVVTTDAGAVHPLADLVALESTSRIAVNERQLSKTIGSRPSRYATERFQYAVYVISG